jgi:hypothetical protein
VVRVRKETDHAVETVDLAPRVIVPRVHKAITVDLAHKATVLKAIVPRVIVRLVLKEIAHKATVLKEIVDLVLREIALREIAHRVIVRLVLREIVPLAPRATVHLVLNNKHQ